MDRSSTTATAQRDNERNGRNGVQHRMLDPNHNQPPTSAAVEHNHGENVERVLTTAAPVPAITQNVAGMAAGMKHLAPLMTSKSSEWYTSSTILDLVCETLGGIDLDPCADMGHQVPANRHFDITHDGLAQEWRAASAFVNPPYGRTIGTWIAKLQEEFISGRTHHAIALLPARIDTKWWAILADHPVCFITGRLTFFGPHPGEPPNSDTFSDPDEYIKASEAWVTACKNHFDPDVATFPSAVVYLGPHVNRFVRLWHSKGCCYTPVYATGGA